MAADGKALVGGILNEDQRNLSTRFPLDDRQCVAGLLDDLVAADIIPSAVYPEDEFDDYREQVVALATHDGRITYIFPEEARLLYALAHVLRPQRTAFLGSYYGYWALWAMPGIVAGGGTVTLVDVDPAVMAIAERNFAAMGWADVTDFVVADAIEVAPRLHDVDLCVLDAESSRTDPTPTCVTRPSTSRSCGQRRRPSAPAVSLSPTTCSSRT